MRSILHPGKPNSQRVQAIPGSVEHHVAVLKPGLTLLQSMVEALSPFQTESAVLRLNNGMFESFCYVMPALSKSPDHAVYFSERFDVAGRVRLETASVTYGLRDGKPWLHCHAVWIEPDGSRRCGHLLPEKIVVAEPITTVAAVLRGVAFSVEPDTETNFSLFVPINHPKSASSFLDSYLRLLGKTDSDDTAFVNADSDNVDVGQNDSDDLVNRTQTVFALRLSPNLDVCHAIEEFCQTNHIARATILGGVGSTVGAVFHDGRIVEPFVTEMLITRGAVKTFKTARGTQLKADIDISMVDYHGGISEGQLKRGENPVLVTFELVLTVDALAE